jgi:SAM-dependent methyltransferase
MNHTDHVNLLRPADLPAGGAWADLGSGTGAFTLALRELVGEDATIHAVDRDRGSLDELGRAYARRFGAADALHLVQQDISDALSLPPLDGVLMANSLHFFKDKLLLRRVRTVEAGAACRCGIQADKGMRGAPDLLPVPGGGGRKGFGIARWDTSIELPGGSTRQRRRTPSPGDAFR